MNNVMFRFVRHLTTSVGLGGRDDGHGLVEPVINSASITGEDCRNAFR